MSTVYTFFEGATGNGTSPEIVFPPFHARQLFIPFVLDRKVAAGGVATVTFQGRPTDAAQWATIHVTSVGTVVNRAPAPDPHFLMPRMRVVISGMTSVGPIEARAIIPGQS